MQNIYSEEEMTARSQFTMFFFDYFRLQRKHTNTFKYPLSVDMIYAMYLRLFPNTTISQADMEFFFTVAGFDARNLYLDLRPDVKFSEEMQKGLAPHLRPNVIRSLGMCQETASLSLDRAKNGFNHFMDVFIRPVKDGSRISTQRLFNLYTLFCVAYNIPMLTRKRMIGCLRARFGEVRKGYADGKSGVSYVFGVIPKETNWETSITLGIGLFEHLNKWFDNLGKTIRLDAAQKPIDDVMALYIKQRTEGRRYAYESQAETTRGEEKESQKETEQDIIGRTEESPGSDVKRGETESTAEANHDADETSGPGNEKPKTSGSKSSKDARRKSSADTDTRSAVQFYGGGSKTKAPRPAATDTGVIRDREEVQRITKEETRAEPDTIEELEDPIVNEGDEEEYNEAPPSKKEIFAALQIAYKINPTTFDRKSMNSYLVSMDVDYAADDLWDEFMSFVGGAK